MTRNTNARAREAAIAPAWPGAVLAVGLATCALLGLAETGAQRTALALVLGGLAVMGVGYAATVRLSVALGPPLYLLGGGISGLAIVQVGTESIAIEPRIVLLPGIMGLAVFGTGLVPVRERHARTFNSVGAGLIFLSVVISGILETSALLGLLLAGAATIAAWDLADHSISLGRQVGRQARTARVTAVHAAATLATAGVIVAAILVIDRVELFTVSLLGLVLLVVAGFALAVGLRH